MLLSMEKDTISMTEAAKCVTLFPVQHIRPPTITNCYTCPFICFVSTFNNIDSSSPPSHNLNHTSLPIMKCLNTLSSPTGYKDTKGPPLPWVKVTRKDTPSFDNGAFCQRFLDIFTLQMCMFAETREAEGHWTCWRLFSPRIEICYCQC